MSAESIDIEHNVSLVLRSNSLFGMFFKFAMILVSLVAFWQLGIYLGNADRFPVERVEIGGELTHVDQDQLIRIVSQYTSRGFYSLDIGLIQDEVVAMPWIKEAYVRRVLPDRLHVDLIEHVALAKWNDDSLLSNKGVIIKIADNSKSAQDALKIFSELPQLRGAQGRDRVLLDEFKKYKDELAGVGAGLLEVSEDQRHSLTLTLKNELIVKIGYEHKERRLKRFKMIFERFAESSIATGLQFDMRYPNGFSVVDPLSKQQQSTTGV